MTILKIPKLVIFEGVDNTGKSTQAKILMRDYPFYSEYVHFSYPKDGRSESQYTDYANFMNRIFRQYFGTVADRSHIGEMVYGPLYRKGKMKHVLNLEKMYPETMSSTVLILFEDKPSNIIKRDDGRSFSIKMTRKIKEMLMFRLAFYRSNIKYKKIININGLTIEEVAQKIQNYLISIRE